MATRTALLLLAALAGAPSAVAQRPDVDDLRRGGAPVPADRGDETLVETVPIRCWWRTSQGAVRLGEPFDVRLTCAVLETESVQVVPDESRLTVAGVQLRPFEVIGGDHPADTRAGRRRFFQYRYTLRLLDAGSIGQDIVLPNLAITYRVQSRIAADAVLAGRDFTYVMPGLPVRVLSLAPDFGVDIRDGADVGLERLDALRFRSRLLATASYALGAGAALLTALGLIGVVSRRRPAASGTARVSPRRILAAAGAELDRVLEASAGGWTPELASAAHVAIRLVAAVAAGREIGEQPLAAGARASDGRLPVRARLPWRPGVAVTSAVTAADLRREHEATPPGRPPSARAGLGVIHQSLEAFTAARFASGAAADASVLAGAAAAVRHEARRLARERLWPRRRTRAVRP